MSAEDPVERPNSVTGSAIVGLLLAAAALAWYVGGSLPARPFFPALLTATAGLLALTMPSGVVRAALVAISPRLDSRE